MLDTEKFDIYPENVEKEPEIDYFMKRGAYCTKIDGQLYKAATLEELKAKINGSK